MFFASAALLLVSCSTAETMDPSVPGTTSSSSSSKEAATGPVIVAENLQIPWDLAWLPSGDLLVTERPGKVVRITNDRKEFSIAGVKHVGEGGLLGMVLHPDFEENHWIYLYLTTQSTGDIENRIDRYRLEGDELTDRAEILTGIPGGIYHDGGRLAFGPDGDLYITAGDGTKEANSQDTTSLAGKILRIHDDGSIPVDNPFGNAVYSYGHRNPQGLAWDAQGQLWATEHGRSGALSGFDELNKIEKGKNYGWPKIEGDETADGMITPVLHSGSSNTWAPASALYLNGSIFFGGLRGQALYEAKLGDQITLIPHLLNQYGRIRTVALGPDGRLYFTTSNTDGRGSPKSGDDRIVSIDPATLR